MCLLNLTDESDDDVNRVIILPTEGAAQEPLVRKETCHEPENVTGTIPSRGVMCGEWSSHGRDRRKQAYVRRKYLRGTIDSSVREWEKRKTH